MFVNTCCWYMLKFLRITIELRIKITVIMKYDKDNSSNI